MKRREKKRREKKRREKKRREKKKRDEGSREEKSSKKNIHIFSNLDKYLDNAKLIAQIF